MCKHFGSNKTTNGLLWGIVLLLLTACGGSSGSNSGTKGLGGVVIADGIDVSSTSETSDQVVTIYFGGTTMTENHWQGHPEFLNHPEIVATLHYLQKGWQHKVDGTFEPPEDKDCVNVDRNDMVCNQHKGMVDGIGRGWQLIDAANPTIFDLLGRGWSDVFSEAKAILEPVADACTGPPCITLNLVGFSRGAVSTMYFAEQILTEPAYEDIKATIKKTNILTFDPVPGDSLLHTKYFNLPANVEYLGFYSEDERSSFFAPVFPVRVDSPTTADPPVNFFIVPGSHETMVGNIRRSGHHAGLCTPFVFNCNDPVYSLDHLSSTLKIVATEMLGSSDWGHVRFRQPDPNEDVENAHFVQLDLDWYDDEIDIGRLQQRFGDKINDIYGYTGYDYMHDYSFTVTLEAWGGIFPGCQYAGIWPLISPDNPRCVYFGPDIGTGLLGTLGASNGPIDSAPDVRPLNYKPGLSYEIWDLIETRGSLDVDGDLVDYSDDNCPTVFNPDQADTDEDGIGDACETVEEDVTPPEMTITVTPDVLWSPNHKMIPIEVTIEVTDDLDPDPTLVLLSVTMDEDDEDEGVGDGHTHNDIEVDENGNISLRAERAGPGDGRIYTITYEATDLAGNISTASATVTVPHNSTFAPS